MKRVCALMMAVLFIVSLLPVAALAEGDFKVDWPSKKTYLQGESIGSVSATLDGSDATPFVTVTPATFTTAGDQVAVTATYQNGEEIYSDTTYVEVVTKGNYSMTVNAPTKTSYAYTESLDPAGLSADIAWKEYDEGTASIVAGAGENIPWPDSRLSVSPTGFTKDDVGQTVPVTVTYSADGVNLTGTFDVDVTGVKATNVEIDGADEREVEVEGTITVTATVDPSEATDEFEWYSGGEVTVTWDSSDSMTATVTGVSEGSTNVGIRSKTTSTVTDSIIVKVLPKEEEAPADFDIVASDTGEVLTGKTLTMKEGTERKLAVKSDVPIVAAR